MSDIAAASVDARVDGLIGARIGYYRPVFERLSQRRLAPSWNWCAFAFGPLWALYRRMYLLAIGSILLAFAVHYAPALWPAGAAASNTIVWGALLFGAFGNHALWLHSLRRLARGRKLRTGPNRILIWLIIALYAGSWAMLQAMG